MRGFQAMADCSFQMTMNKFQINSNEEKLMSENGIAPSLRGFEIWKIENCVLFILCCLLSGMFTGCRSQLELRLVNLAHLNHLYEEIRIDGRDMAIIHIYSEYPGYGWVDAGEEGIACVDDAARAAVVYLRHFELTGDTGSLERARKLLEFCRFMQAEDGLFNNFILNDHSINREGKTSYKSLGWWAARAIWALGEGCRVFHRREPEYARVLEAHLQKTFVHLDTLLAHHPRVDTVRGFAAPRWLLYNSAADATSELMLGLAAYTGAAQNDRARKYLRLFAEGLLAMQAGDSTQFPYGAFLSWQDRWHGWGNSQTQALAGAARITRDARFLAAAGTEAKYFYPYWMQAGFPREMQLSRNGAWRAVQVDTFDQIAYALRPMVVGAIRLFEITQERRFAEIAGALATWFFGNNPAGARMYDPQTGRGFDGILSRTEINRNAGAESTIEALYTLLEVEGCEAAKKYLTRYEGTQKAD